MENVDELVRACLKSENKELREWGKELIAATRFDFGKFDNLQHSDGADVLSYKETCPAIFHLPAPKCLFYCNDFTFIHALDGQLIKARMAWFDADENGFYLCPTVILVNYLEDKLVGKTLPGFVAPDAEGRTEDVGALYCGLFDFLLRLRVSPERVKRIEVKDRTFTVEELSAILGIPAREVKRRAKKEKWQSVA